MNIESPTPTPDTSQDAPATFRCVRKVYSHFLHRMILKGTNFSSSNAVNVAQALIADFIVEKKGWSNISREEIATETHLSLSSVDKAIRALKDEGTFVVVSGKGGNRPENHSSKRDGEKGYFANRYFLSEEWFLRASAVMNAKAVAKGKDKDGTVRRVEEKKWQVFTIDADGFEVPTVDAVSIEVPGSKALDAPEAPVNEDSVSMLVETSSETVDAPEQPTAVVVATSPAEPARQRTVHPLVVDVFMRLDRGTGVVPLRMLEDHANTAAIGDAVEAALVLSRYDVVRNALLSRVALLAPMRGAQRPADAALGDWVIEQMREIAAEKEAKLASLDELFAA